MAISLLLGLALLVLGFMVVVAIVRPLTRNKPVLTAPRCAVCDYDLRAANFIDGPPAKCPECGSDLSSDGAVRFGEYSRGSRRVYLIAAAVCAGVSLLVILMCFGVGLTVRSVPRVTPAPVQPASPISPAPAN